MALRSERIQFPNGSGVELAARLDRPLSPPRAYALFAHCFTCSKDLKAASRISQSLVERGIAVLRFDFTGIGQSEGDFADTNFTTNIADLLAAVDYLRENHEAPRILVGHSLGGAAVVVAAPQVKEAVAVATIGAPSETEHLTETILSQAPDLREKGEAEVKLGPRAFRVKRQLLDDLCEDRVRTAAAGLAGRALLVMHSPIDDTVGIDHARRLYESAKHPKSFVSLDDADHLLLAREEDALYAGDVLAAWAARYLPTSDRSPPPGGHVDVRGGPRGFASEVQAGVHVYNADEPTSIPGGTDTGMSPYDYLLGGLGACTAMTLRMYADRKKWPLQGVKVRLKHGRIHAEDCESCETGSGKVDHIFRTVTIEGPDLDDEQRKRLLEIADKCPVHKTLTTETIIETEAG